MNSNFFCAALLLNVSVAFTQTNSVLDFYPISIGNVWQYRFNYHIQYSDVADTVYYTLTVVDDTVMQNGKTYYVFATQASKYSYYTPLLADENFQRVDSITANVYKYDQYNSTEYLLDSLLCTPPDTFFSFRTSGAECTFVDTLNILETQVAAKHFTSLAITMGGPSRYTLAEGFGLIQSIWLKENPYYPLSDSMIAQLIYAQIDGMHYGTLVSIDLENDPLPSSIVLYQNYPNPFNPGTIIQFGLSRIEFVTLKVFDLLGREVAVLVDEEMRPGRYQTQFNGSALASGMYFYTLKAGSYFETRKMLIVH